MKLKPKVMSFPDSDIFSNVSKSCCPLYKTKVEGYGRAFFFLALTLASISLQCLESKVLSSQCEPAVLPQSLVAERMLRHGEKHKDLLVWAVDDDIH